MQGSLIIRPAAEGPAQIDPEGVSAAVAAIRASGLLGQGERRGRLLEYLVERELAGDGASLKAYAIALDVFDRGEDFDPATDSIVRTEVGRLRRALELYRGKAPDPALPGIEIPKGTYRPRFTAPACAMRPERPRPKRPLFAGLGLVAAALVVFLAVSAYERHLQDAVFLKAARPVADLPYRVLRLSVEPLQAEGDSPHAATLAFGLSSEFVTDLSAYPWISVIDTAGDWDGADYALNGRLIWQGDELVIHSQLIALPGREVTWTHAKHLDTTIAAIQETEQMVASRIVQRLAATAGVAPDLVKSINAPYPDTNLESFLCVLGVYPYLVHPDDAAHWTLRTCLTQVVETYPHYGVAWAALGLVYLDEGRFGMNPRPGANPWADAESAVEEALKYAPIDMATLNAALLLSVEAPERDFDAFHRHAARLLELYPRHPGTLSLIGARMAAVEGRWDIGLALIERALALDVDPPAAFHVVPALHAVAFGTDAKALAETAHLTRSRAPIDLLLRFVAATRAKDRAEARQTRRQLAEIGMEDLGKMRDFIRTRRYDPDLERALLERLDDAVSFEQARR
ncbi:Adenylate cyclase (plasmid) [Rhodovulum sp. P5]|uniref:hypothetical protein n=1 Tax=Rhodovulum sp. P5 TaxID=1564506 RepID=UPI0009C270A4|nr:hypothetical protein [Rhodovulum sp. P5]ARE42401.1 Adenylate cyclase [Rhodovulum sp. P5]